LETQAGSQVFFVSKYKKIIHFRIRTETLYRIIRIHIIHKMVYQYLRRAVVFAALLHSTTGQRTNGIPQDMSAGFQSGDEVQVSYTNGATDGFASGTTFEKNGMYSAIHFRPDTDFRSCGEGTRICPWRQQRYLTDHSPHHDHGRHDMPNSTENTLRTRKLQV
jgi:hypothetical protein